MKRKHAPTCAIEAKDDGISSCTCGANRKVANAKLRDAAPDLLDALCHLLNTMSVTDEEGLLEFAEPVAKARAAIAKATL